jgi:Uma2 family endonuclease
MALADPLTRPPRGLRAPAAGDRLTQSEYFALAERDERRWELWEGRLEEAGVPLILHQSVIERLIVAAHLWAMARGLDLHGTGAPYVGSDIFVVLGDGDVPRPDVTIVSAERRGIVRDKVYGAPDAMVEVLSKSRADQVRNDPVEKMRRYAVAGIPHYLLVDADERFAEEYRLRDGSYLLVRTLTGDDLLTLDALPEFAVPLRALFPPEAPAESGGD